MQNWVRIRFFILVFMTAFIHDANLILALHYSFLVSSLYGDSSYSRSGLLPRLKRYLILAFHDIHIVDVKAAMMIAILH
jgi:hypothetical protein